MLNDLVKFYQQQNLLIKDAEKIISEKVGLNITTLNAIRRSKSKDKSIKTHVYLNIHQYHQEVMGNT